MVVVELRGLEAAQAKLFLFCHRRLSQMEAATAARIPRSGRTQIRIDVDVSKPLSTAGSVLIINTIIMKERLHIIDPLLDDLPG